MVPSKWLPINFDCGLEDRLPTGGGGVAV
jgi:hypothetical protein